MSEYKLISPMLDNFDVGGSISDHDGVQCFPAMRKNAEDRYILKTVSIPASQKQLDALLLTGAYPDAASALTYFKDQADSTTEELQTLQKLSQLEGFLAYEDWQVVPKEDGVGYDVYMISPYRRTLRKHFQREAMTHLMAVNLGLDLCAALAVCRRCGYLYADLKPNNIYLVNEREFRIGDLGFLKLDSLKYATVPDKYRSQYSAPELQDPFAVVTETIDLYAVGLILYQAYNGGELPFTGDFAPAVRFDAPLYADYEMSEIILKACDPDPSARWQDPIEMGQALVSYMQRNGANDTPIITAVPAPVAQEEVSEIENEVEKFLTDDDIDLSDIDLSDIPEIEGYDNTDYTGEDLTEVQESAETYPEGAEPEADVPESVSTDEEIEPDGCDDEAERSASDFENLNFLDDLSTDETSPENNISDVDYNEVSEELSEILSQADALVAHPIPEISDVADTASEGIQVADEPIDVVTEAPNVASTGEEDISDEPAEDTTESSDMQVDEFSRSGSIESIPAFEDPSEDDAEILAAIADAVQENVEQSPNDTETNDGDEDEDNESEPTQSSNKILRNVIIFLLLAIVAAAAFLYYSFIYLQPIYSIKVDGNESSMVIAVDTDVDEALLSVVCSDAHGHQLSAPVVDGVATFTNLAPDTGYNVKVVMDGFHKLTGETAISYSTPAQTNIVQFNVVTGAEDGSAIVSFAAEGPDTGNWSIAYSAQGEAEKIEPMLSHMITLTGLTVGKDYTFKLIPGDDMYITGTDQTVFTARNLVYAKDVNILSCVNGQLTVSWSVPADATVENWTVRCYNDTGYNETIITAETTAIFDNVESSNAYTVEVIAAGMSVSERAYMAANAATISNFQATPTNNGCLDLSWESSSAPESGWVLLYNIDEMQTQGTVTCSGNSAQIKPMIPGANYRFTLQQANGDAVLTAPLTFEAPSAQDFSGYGMTRSTLDFAPCKRPEGDWSWDSVPAANFTNTFAIGDKISLVGNQQVRSSVSDDLIIIAYVFYNQDENTVCYSYTEQTWTNTWSQSYGEFDVNQVPTEPGTYKLCVYFNGKLATEESITVK